MTPGRFKVGDLVNMEPYIRTFGEKKFAGSLVVLGMMGNTHVRLLLRCGKIALCHVDHVELVQRLERLA